MSNASPPPAQVYEADLSAPVWHTFGQKRRLYLPAGNLVALHYAIEFFVWRIWQRWLMQLLLAIKVTRVIKIGNESWQSLNQADSLAKQLACKFNTPSESKIVTSIRNGSFGPFQKTSLLAMDESGQAVFYLKISCSKSADKMIEAESSWLTRLSEIDPIMRNVPELLDNGETLEGRKFISTTVSAYLGSTFVFGLAHRNFLASLGHATAQFRHYRDSADFKYMAEELSALSTILGQEVHAMLENALHEVDSGIGNLQIPLILVHRDFAPWNIKWRKSEIYVFDWEYAEDGGNPVCDFFHFHLIQRALSKWRKPTPRHIRLLLAQALQYLHSTYPNVDWTPKLVRGLLTSYLINLILFYVRSGMLFNASHPVLFTYLLLLRNRERW